jgi:hypothetical protein
MKKITFLFLFLTTCISSSFSQSLKDKIDRVYSFKIKELSAKDLESKYKQLDLFWQELNTDTTTYLPLIRKELQTAGYSSYFYFDMSSYLEMQSYKEKDKRIIENAIQNIQWAEIGTWELIEKMRNFSLNGINTTEIALQLLKQEKIKLTNPETGELFNQGKVFIYLLLPLKKELYLEKMSSYFNEASPESKRSIITLFWMVNSDFSNEKLKDISQNGTINSEVRSYAVRLLNRFSPSESELDAYKDLQVEVREQLLKKEYSKALLNWDKHSWDNLILYSKLMRYFQIDNSPIHN